MDKYKLMLVKNNGSNHDIISISGNLSWRDSLDSLGMELNVDIARNTEDKYMKSHDVVEIGDKLILSNNGKEVFRGIIIDLSTERFSKSVTAFDYAFYLNQSKTIKQFKKMNADVVIKQLCGEFGVPVGNITSISTKINKIYKDDTIADIIKDVLDQATKELGVKYRLEMREGKLCVEKYTDLVVKGEFKPAENISKINIIDAIGSISKSESIADMRNSILISSSDEKESRVVAVEKDADSIKNFGLLQEVESVDDKDMGKVKNIAKNKLKELNRIAEDISIDLLGDDKVRSGRILEIKNDMYKLEGKYLIKACTHTYQNGIHKMSVTVEKVI